MPRCDFDVKTTALSCFRCAVYNYFVHICRLVLLTENRPLIWDLAHSDIVHTSRSVLQSLKCISSSQFLLTAAPRTTTLQDNLHFNHCHALLNSKDSFCTLNWPTHFYCRCTCTCWPYAICVSMQCATMPANHSLIVKHFSVCLRIQDFNTILCHLNKLMLRHYFKGLIKWICLF